MSRPGVLQPLSAGAALDLSESSENLRDLVAHLRERAVSTDGPFRLRSGATSSWYLDARQTTFDGSGALLVARCVLGALDPAVGTLGGLTLGADPIAVAVAMLAAQRGKPLRAFSIRKEAKPHGRGGRLVGPVRAGDRAAVVEDTTTTGGAILEACTVLTEAGVEVIQVVALVDRSGGQVARLLSDRAIPYRGLVTPADLGVS